MKNEHIETDERIETTSNRIATRGFFIMYFLLLISLNYRMWILKQHPREFWDFFAIWFISSTYGFIACARKGVFAHNFKMFFLSLAIFLTIFLFTLFFIKGQIHSVVDVGVALISTSVGIGLVIGAAYFLNRRWKRKEGLEDEK